MEKEEFLQICNDIYKKTLAYSLDKIKINEDGTTTHLHSDEFLDEHPERRDTPEFTKEEEAEQYQFLYNLAKEDYKKFGPLFPKKYE